MLPCQRCDIKKVKTDSESINSEALQQGHDAPELCPQVSAEEGDYFSHESDIVISLLRTQMCDFAELTQRPLCIHVKKETNSPLSALFLSVD